jgi:HK97 family phage portal protein
MLGGVFSRPSAEPVEERDGWEWFSQGTPTWAGVKVDETTSMQLLAVYGSVKFISESIATLPVGTFRDQGEERVPTTPPAWLARPTLDLSYIDWSSQVLTSLLLDGDSVCRLMYSSTGQLGEIIPVADELVQIQVLDGRRKEVRIDGRVMKRGEYLHIPAMMRAGSVRGLSPIEHARQSIGLGLAALEFGAGWLDRDGNMPGVIELPKVANAETMVKMARQWRDKRTRANKGVPGVLDDGAQWKPTGVTSEQMEFLATRKYSAAEIAGQLFMVDPSELGIPVEGSSLTYANLEQRNVRRLQVTLLPWIIRIEKALSTLLPNKQFVKLNVDSALRGDVKTRYEAYKIGLDGKFLTVDEVREMEDRRPLTDAEKEELSPPPPPPAAAAPVAEQQPDE